MKIPRSIAGFLFWATLGLLVLSVWLARPASAAPNDPGEPDPTFGTNGITNLVWSQGIYTIADSVIQPDGKIVTAGGSANRDTGEEDFLVARFTSSGALDASFGSAGVVNVRFGSGKAVGNALALQGDGKIVVAGFVQNSGNYSVALARLNADGSSDSSFNSSGTVTTTGGGLSARGVGMVLQADGKILVAGTIDNKLAVLRFTAAGSLDNSFGTSGAVTTVINTGAAGESIATTVALQADGKILAGGGASNASGCLRGALTRYNSDGSLDNGFGSAGQVYYPRSYEVFKITVQPDQKFLVASSTYECVDPAPSYGTIARFNADGSADNSFSGGFRNFPSTSNNRVMAADIVLGPDKSIWVAAFDVNAVFIAGLNRDGTMNEEFGPDGLLYTAMEFSAATTISIQNDGKVVVGALKVQPNYTTIGRLGRYTITLGCDFSDVCPDDFFYVPVSYLVDLGVISGYSDGTFRPYANATRGQMAKIVTLAFDLPRYTPPSGQTFSDVSRNDTFFEYVETLAHNNVASGDSCGPGCRAFHPYADITRGQLSKIIVIAAGWQLLNPATPHFSDVSPSNPFYTYIETAVARSVISGYSDGTFGWGASATRGQIAKIVYLSLQQNQLLKDNRSSKSTK